MIHYFDEYFKYFKYFKQPMIHLFHNIVWSKYKGGVFSAMHALAVKSNTHIAFTQIAETDSDRVGLAGIDLSYHRYPFELMFKGAYSAIPQWTLVKTLFAKVWQTPAELVLLPGFHTAEYWAMLVAAKLRGKMVGVFCDSTEHDRPRSAFKGLLKRLFFSQCDVFFGYGKRSHDYLKMYGADPAHIFFRCQAAALPHDYDASTVVALRKLQSAAVAPNRFLYVGRLSPEKDLGTLIAAFAIVLKNLPAARLVLVGSGPSRASLEALTLELGLTKNVEFAGSKDVDALREEYLKASCFVLPSTSEPWGLVVNEALAYGCPVVVSSRCGCVPELVLDGVSGYVFNAGEAEDLAGKMQLVVKEFSDPVVAANRCLSLISTFTPEAAARQILDGCVATLNRLRSHA